METGNFIEMIVPSDDRQVVLAGKCGNPQVILGNRTALSAQLFPHSRVMRSGPDVDWQHDELMSQELKKAAEARSVARSDKAVSVLANNDDGKVMPILPL